MSAGATNSLQARQERNLAYLATLQADWDSYGAPPIDPRALLIAGSTAWVPTNQGGIQWELHANGMDIEVEIGPNGLVSLWMEPAAAPVDQAPHPKDTQ